MEANQNGHNFAQTQAPKSITLLQSKSQQRSLPGRFKALAKIIDGAKEFF
jgi:hypothetical protein